MVLHLVFYRELPQDYLAERVVELYSDEVVVQVVLHFDLRVVEVQGSMHGTDPGMQERFPRSQEICNEDLENATGKRQDLVKSIYKPVGLAMWIYKPVDLVNVSDRRQDLAMLIGKFEG